MPRRTCWLRPTPYLITPYHQTIDKVGGFGKRKIGTTGRAPAPAASPR